MAETAQETREKAVGDTSSQAGYGAATPIDHEHLSRFTFSNRELEIEVLGLFVQQTPDYVAMLRHAATDKAWRDAAHTIKGSARAVGAFAVADAAERAEALSSVPDAALRAAAVAEIEAALGEASRYIAGL